MAQRTRRSGTRRARALASRLGLTARRTTVLGCVALAAVLGIANVCVRGSGGFEISRDVPGHEGTSAGSVPVGSADDGDRSGGSTQSSSGTGPVAEAPAEVAVHVDGAVARPGLYRLSIPDVRVADAVDAAGGLAQDADVTTINLAAPLVDGTKVYVPRQGEAAVPVSGESLPLAAGSPEVGSTLVNVNTASIDELQTLSGVGEATARAIVEERESGGPFESVDDLVRVSGIGEKKLARLRDHVCV